MIRLRSLHLTAPLFLLGAPNDDIIIVLQCLDAMLTRRKKQVTLQRAMAFIKRLSMLSLHVLPNASVGILAANRAAVHVSVCSWKASCSRCQQLFLCVLTTSC